MAVGFKRPSPSASYSRPLARPTSRRMEKPWIPTTTVCPPVKQILASSKQAKRVIDLTSDDDDDGEGGDGDFTKVSRLRTTQTAGWHRPEPEWATLGAFQSLKLLHMVPNVTFSDYGFVPLLLYLERASEGAHCSPRRHRFWLQASRHGDRHGLKETISGYCKGRAPVELRYAV
jgi:hypothetical protein